MARTDLLGRELSEVENEVVDLFERMKTLIARDDLAPCVRSNARFAAAAMAQIVTDLDLDLSWDELFQLGI